MYSWYAYYGGHNSWNEGTLTDMLAKEQVVIRMRCAYQ